MLSVIQVMNLQDIENRSQDYSRINLSKIVINDQRKQKYQGELRKYVLNSCIWKSKEIFNCYL